tara:strand:+ start:6063 stop:6722 length:660 start_codon:yes stop_codon:yes gene_type:complete
MKKLLIFAGLFSIILSSCGVSKTKYSAYKGMYDEKPHTILIMPPINNSTNVDAKEYFHTTLYEPLVEAGYYAIPPFLSMDILKRESAYDSELFLNGALSQFGEVFGADLAIFTIIHSWSKSQLWANVTVEVEYIIRSTKTNEVVFRRKGKVIYKTNSGASGLIGVAATVAKTALTDYVAVARACNDYVLKDLPDGKYGLLHGQDKDKGAGLENFKVTIN